MHTSLLTGLLLVPISIDLAVWSAQAQSNMPVEIQCLEKLRGYAPNFPKDFEMENIEGIDAGVYKGEGHWSLTVTGKQDGAEVIYLFQCLYDLNTNQVNPGPMPMALLP